MISIIDYGMGNLRSVQKGFERVGAAARIVRRAQEVREAEKVVLPGVGAFRDAIGHIREQGLIDPIIEAIRSGRPFLGICLGLQLLFEVSYEDGEHAGLGVIPGKVVRFDFSDLPNGRELKVPHMGWNQVVWSGASGGAGRSLSHPAPVSSHQSAGRRGELETGHPKLETESGTGVWPADSCPLAKGLDSGTYFYFVHSYYVEPADPEVIFGRCTYGHDFTAMIRRDNVYATQFHPEKSQESGLRMLRNFAEL